MAARVPRGGMGLSRGNACASASPKQVSAANKHMILIRVAVFMESPLYVFGVCGSDNRMLLKGDHFVNSPASGELGIEQRLTGNLSPADWEECEAGYLGKWWARSP